MTLQDACDAYLRDMKARNLRYSTLKNYKYLFRSWLSYAEKTRSHRTEQHRLG